MILLAPTENRLYTIRHTETFVSARIATMQDKSAFKSIIVPLINYTWHLPLLF
jgi:hypothetical protein